MTGGEAHEVKGYDALMELHDINPDRLLGDKGYDSDDIRNDLADRGIEPVIPPRSNRKTPIEYDRDVLIKARRLGMEQVEITFSDDGSGIPEDVQPHVFDPFFTTRRAQGSTGLGLYIVHNLVTQQLGGKSSSPR